MITINDFMTRILFLHDFPFGQLQEHRDEDGKLHHDSEPAFVNSEVATWYYHGRKHGLEIYKDGTKKYYYDGMLVPNSIDPFYLSKMDIYKMREGIIT